MHVQPSSGARSTALSDDSSSSIHALFVGTAKAVARLHGLQARLSLRCLPMLQVPFPHELAQITFCTSCIKTVAI